MVSTNSRYQNLHIPQSKFSFTNIITHKQKYSQPTTSHFAERKRSLLLTSAVIKLRKKTDFTAQTSSEFCLIMWVHPQNCPQIKDSIWQVQLEGPNAYLGVNFCHTHTPLISGKLQFWEANTLLPPPLRLSSNINLLHLVVLTKAPEWVFLSSTTLQKTFSTKQH